MHQWIILLIQRGRGVDRADEKQGIGSELLARIREVVGREGNITVVTVAHETAIGFYEKRGYVSENRLFWKPCNLWSQVKVAPVEP